MRSGRVAAFVFCVAFAVGVAVAWGHVFQVSDAEHYLRMAHGDGSVMQPFASRQLGPLVARGLAGLFRLTVEHAFVAQGAAALLVLTGFVFFRGGRRVPAWLLIAMAVVPFWPLMFHDLVLPDLGYAALLTVVLVLLRKKQWVAAAAMMLPLMLARESTLLTAVCLLIAVWGELRWRGRLLAVGATVAGALVVARLTAQSVGNTEHLPGMLYLLLKVPWNAVRLFGVRPWSHGYQSLCTEPRWQVAVPLRSISAVGVCGFAWEAPLLALGAMTTTFGLLPVMLVFAWRRLRVERIWASLPAELRFSVVYGVVSFALAPVLGTAYTRLFGYAWPVFLVALPMLMVQPKVLAGLERRQLALVLLHVIACVGSVTGVSGGAVLGITAWVAGALLLRHVGGKRVAVSELVAE